MLKIREAVIVEGRYDKIKLSSIVDAPIIETNGFRVFSDKEKQSLIRKIAETRGILIMTDSDGAGFVIRNFLKGSVDNSKIKNCYIPQIKGKEKRKAKAGKEGKVNICTGHAAHLQAGVDHGHQRFAVGHACVQIHLVQQAVILQKSHTSRFARCIHS